MAHANEHAIAFRVIPVGHPLGVPSYSQLDSDGLDTRGEWFSVSPHGVRTALAPSAIPPAYKDGVPCGLMDPSTAPPYQPGSKFQPDGTLVHGYTYASKFEWTGEQDAPIYPRPARDPPQPTEPDFSVASVSLVPTMALGKATGPSTGPSAGDDDEVIDGDASVTADRDVTMAVFARHVVPSNWFRGKKVPAIVEDMGRRYGRPQAGDNGPSMSDPPVELDPEARRDKSIPLRLKIKDKSAFHLIPPYPPGGGDQGPPALETPVAEVTGEVHYALRSRNSRRMMPSDPHPPFAAEAGAVHGPVVAMNIETETASTGTMVRNARREFGPSAVRTPGPSETDEAKGGKKAKGYSIVAEVEDEEPAAVRGERRNRSKSPAGAKGVKRRSGRVNRK